MGDAYEGSRNPVETRASQDRPRRLKCRRMFSRAMTSESSRRVLVTGASGQIGTELVAALRVRHGSDGVVAMDLRDSQSGDGPSVVGDVLDRMGMDAIVQEWDIGTVYHLAAILSATGERDPAACFEINMGGLLNVLELARENDLRVFAPSSIAVFGPDVPTVAPQDAHLNPTTMYGMTKVAGELLADYYSEAHGVDVRGVRYPGLISWRTPPGGGTTDYAVSIFHSAIHGLPYTCFLSADTRLPMMYMDDAIRATLELMDAPREQLTCPASYNLAAVSFSVEELATEIQRNVAGFEVEYAPDERQAYADSWPDVVDDEVARADWGWGHEFGLEEIVAEMLENLKRDQRLETA